MSDRATNLPVSLCDGADSVLTLYRTRRWMLATAESCTGGLVAAALTEIAGSSAVVERGWVTYSNAAKAAELGVPAALLDAYGAVSEPVARAMAEGARGRAATHAAVAITGIAGPGGGSEAKPVGLVWFGLAVADRPTLTVEHRFAGDRATIRAAAALTALRLLLAVGDGSHARAP